MTPPPPIEAGTRNEKPAAVASVGFHLQTRTAPMSHSHSAANAMLPIEERTGCDGLDTCQNDPHSKNAYHARFVRLEKSDAVSGPDNNFGRHRNFASRAALIFSAGSSPEPPPQRPVDVNVRKIFLLSPAKVSGVRAGLLLNPLAPFALARQFQRSGLPLAEIFTFASGLYFRGKITYARRFAPDADILIRVVTTNAGLLDPETHVTPEALRLFGSVDIHEGDPRYAKPLRRDAKSLARQLAPDGAAILLGSIATAKYRDVLLEAFGSRLFFPRDFIGRGDMSRGGLLLRAARAGVELPYISAQGAIFKGKRAPRISDMPD
jgi:hypothetical protein